MSQPNRRNRILERVPFVFQAALHAAAYAGIIVRIYGPQLCGCVHCHKTFWHTMDRFDLEDCVGPIRCPVCGMHTVLPECAGFPLTSQFLDKMREQLAKAI